MTAPIAGFGDNNIYFVDFGIKTAKDGSYVFDQTSFDRTYTNSPEKFDALTEDKAYASDPMSLYMRSRLSCSSRQAYFHRFYDKLVHGTTSERS